MGRLVAGGNGLNRVVRGVTVLEVSWIEIPEGQVFTHAGDIVVSSMYSVMNSVDEQIRTVRMIKEQEASALCLCHLGMVIKELSPRLIDDKAKKLDMDRFSISIVNWSIYYII